MGIVALVPDMVKCNAPIQWVIDHDHIRLNRVDKFMGIEAWFLYLYQGAGYPAPWGVLQTGPTLWHDFASESCFKYIETMIAECERNHQHRKCKQPAEAPLPKRVLDLGLQHVSDNLRLYESKNEEGHYIALSHCWGTAPNLTTTTEMLEDRKAGISHDSLPRTFKDAISVARKLNVRLTSLTLLSLITYLNVRNERVVCTKPSPAEEPCYHCAKRIKDSKFYRIDHRRGPRSKEGRSQKRC
jgi:hypothetical protein